MGWSYELEYELEEKSLDSGRPERRWSGPDAPEGLINEATAYERSASRQPADVGPTETTPNSSDDVRIREDICEALLKSEDIDASNIEVQVTRGNVRLEGNVKYKEWKTRADEIARAVNGVGEIENQLKTVYY